MSQEAAAVVATGDSIIQNLTAAFTEEPAQIDNLEPETPEAETPEPEEPAKADEPAKESAESAPEASDEDVDGGAADVEEAEDGYYPVDADALKGKWPRSVPLYCINQAAQWAVEAQKGNEAIDKIGGEAFYEPVTKIVESLRSESDDINAFVPFFTGITEAAGDEGTLKVLGHSLYLGLVKGREWVDNPETADFGRELAKKADTFLEMRFGVPAARLDELTAFDKLGTPDKLESWITRYAADPDAVVDMFDEFEEFLRINNDPDKRRLAEENLALKRQQEKPAVDKANSEQDDTGAEFGDYLGHSVGVTLEKVVLTNSPLRDMPTDTAEMKEDKERFRGLLAQKMLDAVTKGSKAKLQKGFANGKHETAVYKHDLTTALFDAVTATDKDRVGFERMIEKLYGKTRNAKLVTKDPTPTPSTAQPLTPTVPTEFKPPAGPKTQPEILKDLEEGFRNLG